MENKVSKTVADIWEEVQEEQRRFNQIIKVLVGLLIVALVVAGAVAAMSYFEFRSLQDRYADAIGEAQATARVSAGEAARERQRMRTELIQLREAERAQRQQADLIRRVDRVLAQTAGERQAETIDTLAKQAMAAARNHANGIRLNMATAHLVGSVLDSGDVTLGEGERMLLRAAQTDWVAPGESESAWRDLALNAPGEEMRSLGYAALAQFHFRRAAEASYGWDDGCSQTLSHARDAEELGLRTMGLYLWTGECLRKAGREAESFDAFASALGQMNSADGTMDNRRMAAHGAGTTLIARMAAGRLDADAAATALGRLKPLTEDETLDASAALTRAATTDNPLVAARALLRYAASLRLKRGEGRVGEFYTTENIGFIYVLEENWDAALKHAREINDTIPLAWNLSVLYIAATRKAEALAEAGERSLAVDLRREAEDARRTLSLMTAAQFDEKELRKLLPPEYGAVVTELIAPVLEREREQAVVESAGSDTPDQG